MFNRYLEVVASWLVPLLFFFSYDPYSKISNTCVCMHVCIFLCTYICMYLCVCMYVCTYVCGCACVCACGSSTHSFESRKLVITKREERSRERRGCGAIYNGS